MHPHRSHVLVLILVLWTVGAHPAAAQSPMRVVFVGSEYITDNDLPRELENLAAGLNDPLMAGQSAVPGFRLMQHFQLDQTMLLFRRPQWDYAILQEHGLLPLDDNMRDRSMIPAVARFNAVVRRSGARPVLFMTWASLRGAKRTSYNDFNSMQAKLSDSYRKAAKAHNMMIAPVGEAFRQALDNEQGIVLLYSDGKTPTKAGTYLAACVVYATIYQKSPFGSSYHAGLKPHQARYLQDLAGEIVIRQHKHWNIPDPRRKR